MLELTVVARYSYRMGRRREFLPIFVDLRDLTRKRKTASLNPSLIGEVFSLWAVIDKDSIVGWVQDPESLPDKKYIELTLVRFDKKATYLVTESKAEINTMIARAQIASVRKVPYDQGAERPSTINAERPMSEAQDDEGDNE
jgi:hypothetical protein